MREIKCEDCPLSWEERRYEGECGDCGCLVCSELYEGNKPVCHLPECIKRFIVKIKQVKIDKQYAHNYDGIGKRFMEEERKDRAFRQAIEECILDNPWNDTLYLCTEDKDGKRHKYNDGKPTLEDAVLARMRYEELLKESEG